MKEEIIAVFDIGKTNKKLLLFDLNLKLVSETEEKFQVTLDDDGFECDNIEKIEVWIRDTIDGLVRSDKYELKAINFTTYGATLVYLDGQGRRLTPVYNYLKPVSSDVTEGLYRNYGGIDEFSRRTASPPLGMLNSGIQALWLKKEKPAVFSKVRTILHFPQYFSYLVSGRMLSEHTSIGCHTAIWDFDEMKYHRWVEDEGLPFPDPVDVEEVTECTIRGRKILVGTGLHDSSSSLAPYFASTAGDFLLISTGTWSISMNPFNSSTLTGEELRNDCLCYLGVNSKPVKSSRLFLGNMHDKAVSMLSHYFKVNEKSFRIIKPDTRLLSKLRERFGDGCVFTFKDGYNRNLREEPDLFVFDNSIEAYHQLMVELSDLAVESASLVIPGDCTPENIYITGGFSNNMIFTKLVASSFPFSRVWTSEISNATALGAAAIMQKVLCPDNIIMPDLGLSEVKI